MARTIQRKKVATSNIITAANAIAGSAAGPNFQLSQPFPVGDNVYDTLKLRLYGTLNLGVGGGAVVPDGGLEFLQKINLSTPSHGPIVENIDGILLHDMLTVKNGKHPLHNDPASTVKNGTGAWEYSLTIPFKDWDGFSGNDLGLDTQKSGQPLLELGLGSYQDFVAGGSAADGVNVVTLDSHVLMDPGPVTDPDLPTRFMPYYGKFQFPVVATVTRQSLYLAFGDRIQKRLYVTQRDYSQQQSRLPNNVVGVNETDRISLKVNSNIIFIDDIGWGALQRENEDDYGLPSMPTGMAVCDFVRWVLGGQDETNPRGGGAGAKLSDALSLLSQNQGTCELVLDVTSGNSPSPLIVVGYESAKIIPLGARRSAPPARQSAQG